MVMNRQSKFYRLTPANRRPGILNQHAVDNIRFETFSRFNTYNPATKIGIIKNVGKLLDEHIAKGKLGHYIPGYPRKFPIIIFGDGIIIIIPRPPIPNPIGPVAKPIVRPVGPNGPDPLPPIDLSEPLPDPIGPVAFLKEYSFAKQVKRINRVAINKVNSEQVIMKMKGTNGSQLILNIFRI